MPKLIVHGYTVGSAVTDLLKDVWIYWKAGGKVTVLRTDATGMLKAADLTANAAEPKPTAEMPWVYTADFDVAHGDKAEVAFTRGARPIPEKQLAADRYKAIVVGDPWPAPYKAPANTSWEDRWIQVGAITAIGSWVTLDILIPNHLSTLTSPEELSVVPMLFELIGDSANTRDYYISELPQGDDLFSGRSLRADVLAGDSAPAPLDETRPYERAIRMTGSVESRVTRLRIVVLDHAGNPVDPYDDFDIIRSGANFTCDLYFDKGADALGEIQFVVHGDCPSDSYTDAYYLLIAGTQVALVDDWKASHTGDTAGPVPTEADELRIVDFDESPKSTEAAIKAQARMRRMVEYKLDRDYRAYSAALPTVIDKPQMPLWMAELQWLGVTGDGLRRLMRFRQKLHKGNPTELKVRPLWALHLSWDGPCAATTGSSSNRNYSYSDSFYNGADQEFLLAVDANGEWKTRELQRTPKPVAFPVSTRRGPKVRMDGQKRRWGRQANGPEKDAIVFEWQPQLVDEQGNEIVRGGNGQLELQRLDIMGVAAPLGRDWNEETKGTDPPPQSPVAKLPWFRISGTNPAGPESELDTIVNLAVEEFWNAHQGVASVTALPLAAWKVTMRKIVQHESKGMQFGVIGTDIGLYESRYYGKERGMPVFGPPHGYGLGQLDNPPVTDNACWSFVENIKFAVDLIMREKSASALTQLGGTVGTTDQWRAMFRRSCVRLYNGWAPEFQMSGGVWKINPVNIPASAKPSSNGKPDSRVEYPNLVLGTNTSYWDNDGSSPSDYDWPINFTEADWGPME